MSLRPYVDEIIAHCQYGFRRSVLTADQIYFIRQILERVK
jgi:hypothetical protein